MLVSERLHHLLLLGSWLCVYGNPVRPPDFELEQDRDCYGPCTGSLETAASTSSSGVKSDSSGPEGATGQIWKAGAGGAVDPHGQPEGTGLVMQTGNGGSADGRSGPSQAGGEAWSQRNEEKKVGSEDAQRRPEALPVYPDAAVTTEAILSPKGGSTVRLPPGGYSASFTAIPQSSAAARDGNDQDGEDQTKSLVDGDPLQDKDPEPSIPSSTSETREGIQTLTSHSPIPPLVFVSIQTSTPLSIWGHDGATMSPIQEPLLPEIGPNLMPREDGPESLWTEATRPGGTDTVVPLSQDEATEGTMSSEALPLIFEPLEDVTSERAPAEMAAMALTLLPGSARPPPAGSQSEVDPDQLDTVEMGAEGPSRAPLMPDWTSPWQTSGTESLEAVGSSAPAVSSRDGTEPEQQSDRGESGSARTRPPTFRVAVRTPDLEKLFTASPTFSSVQHAITTATIPRAHQPVHKSRSGLEEMDSEEESDEDEDEENSEESVEDESEEELTDTPKTLSTQPPYSLIPPPPVWVQHNQGLMRSWVELIREKAGYVSGMLAPVGIGITGALLIVGVLYSIRMIHRKRRNSFKHQRRKVRQPEQPREPGTSRQDQAMLLADSSEDEF